MPTISLDNQASNISLDMIKPRNPEVLDSEIKNRNFREINMKPGHVLMSQSGTMRVITSYNEETNSYECVRVKSKGSLVNETIPGNLSTSNLDIKLFISDPAFANDLVEAVNNPKARIVIEELLNNYTKLTPLDATTGTEKQYRAYLNNIDSFALTSLDNEPKGEEAASCLLITRYGEMINSANELRESFFQSYSP